MKRGKYTGKGSLPALVKKMACIIDPPCPEQSSNLGNVTTSSTGSRNSTDMEAVQRRLDERIKDLTKNNGRVESFYAIAIGREPGIYTS